MKKLLVALALTIAGTSFAGGQIKEVCIDKKDKAGKVVKGKDGKAIKECRKIKVHKKLEGTPVPDQQK